MLYPIPLFLRVINTVVSEPYVNFTLYTKKCNCSLDSCGDQAENVNLNLSEISNVIEVDPGRSVHLNSHNNSTQFIFHSHNKS